MLKTFNLHLSNTFLMIKHLQTECIYLKLPKVQKNHVNQDLKIQSLRGDNEEIIDV